MGPGWDFRRWTAVIESAQCCVLALLTGKNPDPFSATSRGVGRGYAMGVIGEQKG